MSGFGSPLQAPSASTTLLLPHLCQSLRPVQVLVLVLSPLDPVRDVPHSLRGHGSPADRCWWSCPSPGRTYSRSPDTTHLPHPRSNALRQARSTRRTQQHGSSILPPGCSGDLVGRAPTCLLLLGGGALVDRLVLACRQDRGLGLDH